MTRIPPLFSYFIEAKIIFVKVRKFLFFFFKHVGKVTLRSLNIAEIFLTVRLLELTITS